jgi:DNA-binding transcriptional regulator YdaS (Cro superfamily)
MDTLRAYLKSEWGNLSKLADALGVTPGAIAQWKRVPAERVPQVSRITGIPREKLRPDIFGEVSQ